MTDNQNPEQKARDNIDALLMQAGWVVQKAKRIDLNVGLGQAVREYRPMSARQTMCCLWIKKR